MLGSQILEALKLVAPVFLIVLLGWGIRKFGLADENWVGVLNRLAFYVGFPTYCFANLYAIDTSLLDGKLLLVNLGCLAVALAVTLLVSAVFESDRLRSGVILLCTMFGNVAYLGYPINERAFGDVGLRLAVVVGAVHICVYFTIVVAIAEYRSSRSLSAKDVALRIAGIPLIWAVILGTLFAVLKIGVPPIIATSLRMLAGMASPVVLLALGIFLSGVSFKGRLTDIAVISALKLALFPALLWVAAALAGLEPVQSSVSVLEAAMPVGISTFTLVDQMRLDKELAASTILVTTLLSVVTIPVLIALLAQ